MAPFRIISLLLQALAFTSRSIASNPLQHPVIPEAEDEASCHNACTALLNELGDIIHYGPTSELRGFTESFFSAHQQEDVPACVVTPQTSQHVASTVSILRQYACPFAVKSGGHAPSAGLSNSAGGITIDLKLLNQVTYLGAQDWDGSIESADGWTGEITRVGPGNRWSKVYETLQPLGRNVVGGRAATVGVGGFIMGGGISFLSHPHGWSTDSIRNFEIVLPNGTLTNVNHISNPTLFSALRGSGSNFGIVTRFDMETYKQGNLWGGYNFWSPSPSEISARKAKLGIKTGTPLAFDKLTHLPTLGRTIVHAALNALCFVGYHCPTIIDFLKAFEEVVLTQDVDINSHIFMSFAYNWQVDHYLMGGQLVHLEGKAWPEIFKPFRNLKKPMYSNARIANVSDLAEEIAYFSQSGWRQSNQVQALRSSPLSSTTSKVTLHELLSSILDVFIQEFEKIKHIDYFLPGLTFQPINLNEIRHFQKNGGNAFGINESDGPLIILSLSTYYSSPPERRHKDDALVQATTDRFNERCKQLAKDANMHHPFQYLNYADGRSDVFEGYGKEKREWLRGVKRSVVGREGRWDVGGIKI